MVVLLQLVRPGLVVKEARTEKSIPMGPGVRFRVAQFNQCSRMMHKVLIY